MPYFSIAARMHSRACRARSETSSSRSQSKSSSFSSSNDGTAIGPVPVSQLCISCERDGAATAMKVMAQPWWRALPRTRAMIRGVFSEAAAKSSRAVTMEASFSGSM